MKFFRINRQTIINAAHIVRIDRVDDTIIIELSNNVEIPLHKMKWDVANELFDGMAKDLEAEILG